MGVSPLTNEEPLVVMKTRVDVMREIIGKYGGDSRDGVVREREASLCCGGRGSVCEGASGAEDRDGSRDRGGGSYRGSEVFTSGRSHKDVVGVNGDVFVERGEKESVEDFLSDLGGSGRHCR